MRAKVAMCVALACLVAACGETGVLDTTALTATTSPPVPTTSLLAPATTAAAQPISGSFDVGGRSLYMECLGEGSPTVILEAGMTGDHRTWTPVQAEIAEITRVCSYNRAGIQNGGQDPRGSDPATTPRPASAVTADLHALLDAAGLDPPYVLVGFSFGGLFAQHYAATYPDEITGLMLVESNHWDEARQFEENLTAEQIEADRAETQNIGEGIDVYASFDEVAAIVDQMPDVPLVVVTAKRSGEWPPGWDTATFDALRAEQQADLVLLTTQGRQVVADDSGHFVIEDRPDLVIDQLTTLLEEIGADR